MIEKIINEYLKEQRDKPYVSSGKFNVSDAGRCHLMRFWKRKAEKVKADFDERAYRIFEVGHIFHGFIQDILGKKGDLLARELRVEDEHRAGIIDAIVQSNGKVILYDFKTVHSRKFFWIKKEADLHYHYQAATYTSMVKVKPTGFSIDETRICYISKDDLLIKEVPVFITDKQLVADWNPLIAAWTTNTEPEKNPMSWECKYCNYIAHCKEKP